MALRSLMDLPGWSGDDTPEATPPALGAHRHDRCDACRCALTDEPGWLCAACLANPPRFPRQAVAHIDPTADRGPWTSGELADLGAPF